MPCTPACLRPGRGMQMGVVLVAVELLRKNKEDTAKKEKEAADKEKVKQLHERHLQAEKVRLVRAAHVRGWV